MKDIAFTFGIITLCEDTCGDYLKQSIESIIKLNIPEYEIIVVGNGDKLKNDPFLISNSIKVIDFDFTIKKDWITKKKNLITQNAKYENIIYQHDYIYYNSDWYVGFKEFGEDFKVCMTKIINTDGSRFRDWVVFPFHHAGNNRLSREVEKLWKYAGIENNESMIPYTENRLNKYQYFSGSYWVAKKSIMTEIPLDENLSWGQGEDVDFSQRFTAKYKFSMNELSSVNLLKWKQDAFGMIRSECLTKCIEYAENNK